MGWTYEREVSSPRTNGVGGGIVCVLTIWLTELVWKCAQTNFTSLATPSAVGSGSTALTTLMHEGGHAAHFANITQGSPFFSQVRERV